MKPLRMKQVFKILSAASGDYTSFRREQQFEVSNLVLKLLEVMCVDKTESTAVNYENIGISVNVQSGYVMESQCKKAKPMHEVQATIASKKIKTNIQSLGCMRRVAFCSSKWQFKQNHPFLT